MASSPFQSYHEARDYLYSLKHRGAIYGIDRMRVFTEKLGYPQRKYPTIHVAGTNGKGSTCAMLESVFRRAGYRTGMFTSPHLIHQGERVQINRELLDHSHIVDYTNYLSPVAEAVESEFKNHHPTFFEFMTAMAFLHFASEKVDIGIIETGLGGRLDATNVLAPEICIITSIAKDHIEILGDTLEQIATEKAGIMKTGVPVVLGELAPEAEAVFIARAKALNCKLFSVRDYYGAGKLPLPQTSLPGEYQQRNASVVALACKVLEEEFPRLYSSLETGLLSVDWAGRWDKRFVDNRDLILDSTHNPEGAAELERNLSHWVEENGIKPIIVCGTLGEHRAESLMPVVASFASELVLTKPKQPRACDFQVLRSYIPDSFEGKISEKSIEELVPSPNQIDLPSGHPVLITGSIYLIGEFMDKLFNEQLVGEETLQD